MFSSINYGTVPSFGRSNSFAGFNPTLPSWDMPLWNGMTRPASPWTLGYNTPSIYGVSNGINGLPFNGLNAPVAPFAPAAPYSTPANSTVWNRNFVPAYGMINSLPYNAASFGSYIPAPMTSPFLGSIESYNSPFGYAPSNSFSPMNSEVASFNGLGFNGQSSVAPTFNTNTNALPFDGSNFRCPLVNVWEDAVNVHIDIEVPGVNLDDIDLQVAGSTLIIKTGRVIEQTATDRRTIICEHGPVGYARSIQLPAEIDTQKVDAKLIHGVLRLELAKVAAQQHRTIRVAHLATA